MKINLSEPTKYYKYVFDKKTLDFKLVDIPLDQDNWWYVQVNGTIRAAFLKYGAKLPEYSVILETPNHTTICVYRGDIKSEEELLSWHKNQPLILSELKQQAESNSSLGEGVSDCMTYEFKIL